MDNDFNPFDLSAQRPKPDEAKLDQKEKPRPKPTVRRVSMGPLFHSRITRIIALILSLVLFVLLGYAGMNYYLNQKAAKSNSTASSVTKDNNLSTVEEPTTTATTQQDPVVPAQTTQSTSPSSPAPPNTTPSSQPKIYCRVSGMPEGVCVAITSIEKDGLKGNKYVLADTSQLPDGVVIDINEKSWNQGGPNNGSTDFTGKAQGKTYSGKAFYQFNSGTWKVISYTLN